MLTFTDAEYQNFAGYIERVYGINLRGKKQMVELRLVSALEERGCRNLSDYVNGMVTGTIGSDEVELMLNKLTTNYSYFMRENSHYEFLKQQILPYLVKFRRDRAFGIWSAGCASGQEPYNIAMVIDDFFGFDADKYDTRILATDISQSAMDVARKGIYKSAEIKDIPPVWRERYFTRRGDDYEVCKKIKDNVIFRTFNLIEPINFKTKFDIIFCRNVMIYFDKNVKDALAERFYDASNDGAYLMIGHSESLSRMSTRYSYIMPSIYRKVENK